ncbi:MAG: hypothetical protein IPL70_13180 [Uliginosibacterium sp.]|nr:hypothetical protein [Uliginosibacterium sp.]
MDEKLKTWIAPSDRLCSLSSAQDRLGNIQLTVLMNKITDPNDMTRLLVTLLLVLACSRSFGSDEAVFDPYNGRIMSHEELAAANVAVADFYRRVASKHYGLYSKNGVLKLNILLANENSRKTCVLVMSARDDVRGGAAEYCVDNDTKKILSFKKTK